MIIIVEVKSVNKINARFKLYLYIIGKMEET